jgi:PAS domain S-box-containing protein
MTPEYDKALAKYYSKLKILSLPLISWDIFANQDFEINKFNIIQKQWKLKVNFNEVVYQSKRAIIITNSNQEIIFASQGINLMNGYRPHEIIGKSPKVFQGELTSKESKNKIRKAIENKLPFKEVIVNYRKDGTTYLCEIDAFPKFNRKGDLINYIAFERIAS